jgi:hypothetical protein
MYGPSSGERVADGASLTKLVGYPAEVFELPGVPRGGQSVSSHRAKYLSVYNVGWFSLTIA